MSKLEELIAELCPDGVEYKPLWSLTAWDKKFNAVDRACQKTINPHLYLLAADLKSLETEGGDVKLLTTNISNIFTTEELAGEYIKEGEIVSIPWGGNAVVQYYKGKYVTADNRIATSIDTSILDNKYLYYYMCNKQDEISSFYRGSGIKHPDMSKVLNMRIPVPPLEVQREIVRVLDNFTFLTAELSAELSARKKQYEYYRNKLLSFNNVVERIELSELFEFRNGLSKGKEYFGKGIPFIRYTDVYNNRYLHEKDITALVECSDSEKEKLKVSRGDVLFTRTSETAEDVGWSTVMLDDIGDCVFNGFTIKATPKTNKLLPEYCAYCFSTNEFRKYVTSHCSFTTRASLTGDTISKYKLAVPSIDIQKKIAEVLDNFESICNNLGIGLPAEIEARQKQYEYYRDLLLTFVESGTAVATDRQTDRQTDRLNDIKILQYVFGYAPVTLNDISYNCDSQRRPVTKGKRSTGIYPYYGASGIVDYVDDYIYDGDYLLISEDGANLVARVTPIAFSISGKNWVNNHAHVLKFKDPYEQRYVEMYMNGMDLSKYISGAAQPKLNQKNLNTIEIMLPFKTETKRIVETLDRLDRLCNDVAEGLPAEIEARQKQYEYYRDKLLSFKEKEN